MKRVLCAIALAGFACAASAQLDAGGHAKTFAGQEATVAMLQPHPAGARSFNDVVDARSATPRAESRLAAGGTSAVPEPQTYALLLAGLCAIIFIAVRRSRP